MDELDMVLVLRSNRIDCHNDIIMSLRFIDGPNIE